MTRTTLILAACLVTAALGAAGCSRDPVSTTETTSGRLASPTRDDPKINEAKLDERDRSGAAVTPLDQSSSPADLVMVQEIRRAIVADDTLSVTAKNTQIVTSNGIVVLRGSVQTARERESLGARAAAVAGPEKVVNLLDVKNP
jgi:hyperosmotically inducible protein